MIVTTTAAEKYSILAISLYSLRFNSGPIDSRRFNPEIQLLMKPFFLFPFAHNPVKSILYLDLIFFISFYRQTKIRKIPFLQRTTIIAKTILPSDTTKRGNILSRDSE